MLQEADAEVGAAEIGAAKTGAPKVSSKGAPIFRMVAEEDAETLKQAGAALLPAVTKLVNEHFPGGRRAFTQDQGKAESPTDSHLSPELSSHIDHTARPPPPPPPIPPPKSSTPSQARVSLAH